jgi:hypothetical protein
VGARLFQSANRLSAFTLDGRLRARLVSASPFTVDLSGSVGWFLERRASHMMSVSPRPGPLEIPTVVFDYSDSRSRATVGVWLECGAAIAESPVDLIVEAGVRRSLGADEPSRSDVDLGRTIFRLGAGLRWRF